MTLIDAGPLVALFDASDRDHQWADDVLRGIKGPMTTCEAVLTEASFLLQRWPETVDALLQRVESGVLRIEPMATDALALRTLMKKYRSVPMSLADACLVRLSERFPSSILITSDSDFYVYRRNGRQVIPLIAPVRKRQH